MSEEKQTKRPDTTWLEWGLTAFVSIYGGGYGGALLAASLSGPRTFQPDFVEGAESIVGLLTKANTPRLAWPEEYQAALPGLVTYWISTVFVFVMILLTMLWLRSRLEPTDGIDEREHLGVKAQAGEAKKKDLQHLLLKEPDPFRLIVGRFGRRWISLETERKNGRKNQRSSGRGAVAHIGPSQCGKTTNVVFGVNRYEGPVILFSVKDDALVQTLSTREKRGEVKTFDPTGVTGRANASWSPLRSAASIQGALKAAHALAATAPKSSNSGKGDFWNMQAESLMTAFMLIAANAEDKTIRDVVRWVTTRDMPADKNPGEVGPLVRSLRSDAEAGTEKRASIDFANDLLQGIWKGDERTTTSIYATARNMIWAWTDPSVARWSKKTDVDLDWLLSGNNTLYISAPPTDQERMAPVLSGLIADLIDQIYAYNVRTGRPLDIPLLLVIDEAATAKLQDLPEWAATLSGLGIQLVTVWQSEAQIDSIYGDQAASILTNHTTKIHYPGNSDTKGLERLSILAGQEYVPSGLTCQRASGLDASPTLAAIAPPSLLRQMVPGTAALVSATLPIALIDVSFKPGWRARRQAAQARRAERKRRVKLYGRKP